MEGKGRKKWKGNSAMIPILNELIPENEMVQSSIRHECVNSLLFTPAPPVSSVKFSVCFLPHQKG